MSLLRATTGTASRSPNLESRPLPRDNNHKKLSLFKRWTSRGIAFTGITHHNNHNRHQHQQQQQQQHLQTQHSSSSTTTSTTASTATMVTSSSSSSLSSSIVGSSSSNYHKLHTDSHYYKHHINSKQRHHMAKYCLGQHYVSLPSTTTSSTTTPPINIMHFMQNDCPNDVLPLILAFLGPQKTCVIGRTNRFWRQVIVQESTWRRLCEELYKVRTHFLSTTISMVMERTFYFSFVLYCVNIYFLFLCCSLFLHYCTCTSCCLLSQTSCVSGKKGTRFQNHGRNITNTIHVSP
ncbi:MAG: Mn2+/Fe2+ NRAMP family transporter [Bacillariaceae sp.]|jgi:Mn2+/Fe2+ NRAMP family transporter